MTNLAGNIMKSWVSSPPWNLLLMTVAFFKECVMVTQGIKLTKYFPKDSWLTK